MNLAIYFRLVCYAIVFVSSLTHLLYGSNHNALKLIFAGNLVVSALLAIAALEQDIFRLDSFTIRNTIVTPAIVIWAAIHLLSVFRIKS